MLERLAGPGGHAGGVLVTAVRRRRAGRVRGRRWLEQHRARRYRGLAIHQGSVAGRRHWLFVQGETAATGPVDRAKQARRVLARAQGMGRQSVVTLYHRDLVQL